MLSFGALGQVEQLVRRESGLNLDDLVEIVTLVGRAAHRLRHRQRGHLGHSDLVGLLQRLHRRLQGGSGVAEIRTQSEHAAHREGRRKVRVPQVYGDVLSTQLSQPDPIVVASAAVGVVILSAASSALPAPGDSSISSPS